jgi:fatty acid desaturase
MTEYPWITTALLTLSFAITWVEVWALADARAIAYARSDIPMLHSLALAIDALDLHKTERLTRLTRISALIVAAFATWGQIPHMTAAQAIALAFGVELVVVLVLMLRPVPLDKLAALEYLTRCEEVALSDDDYRQARSAAMSGEWLARGLMLGVLILA